MALSLDQLADRRQLQAQFGGHRQELGFTFRTNRHQQAAAGLWVAQQVLLVVAQAPILWP